MHVQLIEFIKCIPSLIIIIHISHHKHPTSPSGAHLLRKTILLQFCLKFFLTPATSEEKKPVSVNFLPGFANFHYILPAIFITQVEEYLPL